jgi:hypothetical protein
MNMADKYDEITQLEIAYDALKSQPRDAQRRMLVWLEARLQADFDTAMDARIENEKRRREATSSPPTPAEPR